jgi:hypothetical protein
MAYIDKEKKAKLSMGIKKVLKKYGYRGSISIIDSQKLVVKLKGADIIRDNYNDCMNDNHFNPYIEKDSDSLSISQYDNFKGVVKIFIDELFKSINIDNYDNSDVMTDYFDVGYYSEIIVLPKKGA